MTFLDAVKGHEFQIVLMRSNPQVRGLNHRVFVSVGNEDFGIVRRRFHFSR